MAKEKDESVNAIFEKLCEHKHDYANVASNENLQRLLKREKQQLKLTCRCIKLKKKIFTTKQERMLVITDKAVYNFRPSDSLKSYRWRLELHDVAGIVVSKESSECVIQVLSNKEGYRFQLGSCLHSFVETIANCFRNSNQIELPLEVTDEEDLEKYVHQMMKQITIATPSATAVSMLNIGKKRNSLSKASTKDQTVNEPLAYIWQSQETEVGGRQGWLSKRKGDKDAWDAKYVVLTADSLRYFTPRLKGSFDLKGCRAMARSAALKMRKPMSEMQLPVLGDTDSSGVPSISRLNMSGTETPIRATRRKNLSTEAKRSFSLHMSSPLNEPATAPSTIRGMGMLREAVMSPGSKSRLKAVSAASMNDKVHHNSSFSVASPRRFMGFDSKGSQSPKITGSTEVDSLKEDEIKIWPFYITTPNRSRTVEVAAGSYRDLQRWLEAYSKISSNAAESRKRHWLVDGWLWKKNPHENTKNNWRKRYFIVHGEKCFYFEMVEKGCLNLAEGVSCSKTKVVRATQRSDLIAGIPSDTNFSYRFNVNDAGRIYPFAADSRQDMDDWIQSVNKLSKERSRKGGSRVNNVWASLKEKAPEGKVTIVFSGVQGISELWNKVDGAAMGLAIDLYDGLLRDLMRKFRGYEVKTEGTTFMVAFFTAWEALSWCLAVQEALVTVNWPEELVASTLAAPVVDDDGAALFCGMRVYMGMQVGMPKGKRAPTTGRMDYYGPSVNKSARVAHAANGGQVLITEDVLNDILKAQEGDFKIFQDDPFVIKDMGFHGLKGIARPTHIYEVLPRSLHERSDCFGKLHTLGLQDPPRDEDPPDEDEESEQQTVNLDEDGDETEPPNPPPPTPAKKKLEKKLRKQQHESQNADQKLEDEKKRGEGNVESGKLEDDAGHHQSYTIPPDDTILSPEPLPAVREDEPNTAASESNVDPAGSKSVVPVLRMGMATKENVNSQSTSPRSPMAQD
eukprot:CAMPEP_0184499188 /NCGR_PEP_ID=MMETSP0113_2-20130426/40868_1 /TAXON_ID=91329 /ORGANISM="Norrisiella sphaerica, Strain BC52" /LENGTH=962 /DNA_ID=CAMNT_0026887015 /DNA_START=37 /DNA_END=2925 /DNA_ORIENTATION=-